MLDDLYYILRYNGLKNKLIIKLDTGSILMRLYRRYWLSPEYETEWLFIAPGYSVKNEAYYIKFSYNLLDDLHRALQRRDDSWHNLDTIDKFFGKKY